MLLSLHYALDHVYFLWTFLREYLWPFVSYQDVVFNSYADATVFGWDGIFCGRNVDT